jgi:hypothetical protein
MVRREADEVRDVGTESVRCVFPVGASPTPVSVGAPGSRVAVRSGETPAAEADRRKPLRGEQPYGPQQMKPAASSHKQPESRAAHVTAKAMAGALDPKRAPGLSGVWGVARTEGRARNARGPSSLPWSRRADSYKPRAKSSGAERESEGTIVVMIWAQQNARGAKGPCFGCVG